MYCSSIAVGGYGRRTYLFFLEHHKVEVLDAFLTVPRHPLAERRLADDLADVLVDQIATAVSLYPGGNSRGDIRSGA
jgi:hypothetical protein